MLKLPDHQTPVLVSSDATNFVEQIFSIPACLSKLELAWRQISICTIHQEVFDLNDSIFERLESFAVLIAEFISVGIRAKVLVQPLEPDFELTSHGAKLMVEIVGGLVELFISSAIGSTFAIEDLFVVCDLVHPIAPSLTNAFSLQLDFLEQSAFLVEPGPISSETNGQANENGAETNHLESLTRDRSRLLQLVST